MGLGSSCAWVEVTAQNASRVMGLKNNTFQ